ncbi:MAG: PAS domain S-box protein [Candidatus Aureabacteria bacterium]|nr:PAS domain S-box protein [Candidatus Auribacterota bacterium]
MSEDRSLHTMSEFYRRLIEYISDGLCVSTRGDGKILYANQAFLDILDIECDPPALVGRRLDEFIPAVHPGGLLADMPAPADTVRGKEFHFRTAKGNERSVIYDAFFAEWPGAEGRAVVLLLRDISEWRRTDDALRRSEEQFRSVFESMTDCILIWDRAYNYLYANRAAIEHVGTTPERVIGRNMRDGLGHIPEFMKLWMSRIDHVFATGKPLQVQDSVPVGDRLVRSESSISPIRDSKGDIFAVGVVYRDITESKKANEALKESENKYRGLFESSRDAIMTLEPPSWKFTSGNPATMEMFRARNAEEFTKQGPWVLSPERQPDGRASAEKALEMIETAMREGSHYFEWTHKRLDGEEFPATVLLTRMEQAGKVIVQATVRDITESKRAEEALRESEERYRIQFEQTIDALFLADTQTGIILECNRAAMELIGREKSEMVGQHQRILHPSEEWDGKFSKSFKQHIIGETFVETKVIKKSGEIRDVAIKASTFDLKGKKVILAIFHDITKRKKIEEENRKHMQELEVFYKASIGREERIIELKKEIEMLKKELGK